MWEFMVPIEFSQHEGHRPPFLVGSINVVRRSYAQAMKHSCRIVIEFKTIKCAPTHTAAAAGRAVIHTARKSELYQLYPIVDFEWLWVI